MNRIEFDNNVKNNSLAGSYAMQLECEKIHRRINEKSIFITINHSWVFLLSKQISEVRDGFRVTWRGFQNCVSFTEFLFTCK